jgi:signal recognition particle GTPase
MLNERPQNCHRITGFLKKATKNSHEKCIPSSSKTVSIVEEVETIYYDASEDHTEFEVMMKVECDFEDIDSQDNGFLDMSQMEQVLEEVPEMKVERKEKQKNC